MVRAAEAGEGDIESAQGIGPPPPPPHPTQPTSQPVQPAHPLTESPTTAAATQEQETALSPFTPDYPQHHIQRKPPCPRRQMRSNLQ